MKKKIFSKSVRLLSYLNIERERISFPRSDPRTWPGSQSVSVIAVHFCLLLWTDLLMKENLFLEFWLIEHLTFFSCSCLCATAEWGVTLMFVHSESLWLMRSVT